MTKKDNPRANVIKRANKQGYNCQLTHWLPKEDFGFIKNCMLRICSDEKRKCKVFSCKLNDKVRFALFVNNVGIYKDSALKLEIKAGVKNKREYRF